ncbi:MAG TPA: hypothetical protein PKA61_09605 [Nitrospira sp.]|nr:hypothetical protein [Nitrospira sp.]
MRRVHLIITAAAGLLVLNIGVPSGASAKPKKSTPESCTTKDLNTNFGASCNDQMQQDLMGNKPYTHVLFCGGDTMLCCTVDNSTNQVINCRKPAGARVLSGGATIGATGMAGVQRRGVEESAGANEALGESTPVPDWVKESAAKAQAGDKTR